MSVVKWHILCEPAVFEKLRGEEVFWQVLALARAVNALGFAYWVMRPVSKDRSLNARRTRANSFLFSCGILYEALLLVQKMNKNFHANPNFSPLKALLKNQTAQRIRNFHLNRARNNVVFHYLPESFGQIVNIPGPYQCVFVSGSGSKRHQTYYGFADTLAQEFLVGFAGDSEKFYKALGNIMRETGQLVANFVDAAEYLIKGCLLKWDFKMLRENRPAKSTPAMRKLATSSS